METVIEGILESLPWIERSLSVVTRDRRLLRSVHRRWSCRVYRRWRGTVYRWRGTVYRRWRGTVYRWRWTVEVSGVSGGGLNLSVYTRMVADRITEIHQLVSFTIACFRLSLQSGLQWNLYLGLGRGRHLSLISELWLVDPHAPVNKEIVLIIWNRARCGLFVWTATLQAGGRNGGD